MVTAFIVLGMEGVVMYRVGPGSRPTRKLLHVVCNTLALVVGTVGVYFVFEFHKKNGFPDFYSTHSWMGMATSVVFVLQYLVGFFFFVAKLGGPVMRAAVLPAHQYFGLVSHGLAVATVITGIFEKQTFFSKCVPGASNFEPAKVWANWVAMSVVFATVVAMGHLKAQQKLPAGPVPVNGSSRSLLGNAH